MRTMIVCLLLAILACKLAYTEKLYCPQLGMFDVPVCGKDDIQEDISHLCKRMATWDFCDNHFKLHLLNKDKLQMTDHVARTGEVCKTIGSDESLHLGEDKCKQICTGEYYSVCNLYEALDNYIRKTIVETVQNDFSSLHSQLEKYPGILPMVDDLFHDENENPFCEKKDEGSIVCIQMAAAVAEMINQHKRFDELPETKDTLISTICEAVSEKIPESDLAENCLQLCNESSSEHPHTACRIIYLALGKGPAYQGSDPEGATTTTSANVNVHDDDTNGGKNVTDGKGSGTDGTGNNGSGTDGETDGTGSNGSGTNGETDGTGNNGSNTNGETDGTGNNGSNTTGETDGTGNNGSNTNGETDGTGGHTTTTNPVTSSEISFVTSGETQPLTSGQAQFENGGSQSDEHDETNDGPPGDGQQHSDDKGNGEQQSVYKGEVTSLDTDEDSSSHFMGYFLVFMVLCIAGYIIFHNKQKIIALVLEGKNSNGSRRPSSKHYKQLKTEDVMPSLEKSASRHTYVF